MSITMWLLQNFTVVLFASTVMKMDYIEQAAP